MQFHEALYYITIEARPTLFWVPHRDWIAHGSVVRLVHIWLLPPTVVRLRCSGARASR